MQNNNHKYVRRWKGKNGKWLYEYNISADSKRSAKKTIENERNRRNGASSSAPNSTLTIDKYGNKKYERYVNSNHLFDRVSKSTSVSSPSKGGVTTKITHEKGTIHQTTDKMLKSIKSVSKKTIDSGKKFIDKLLK